MVRVSQWSVKEAWTGVTGGVSRNSIKTQLLERCMYPYFRIFITTISFCFSTLLSEEGKKGDFIIVRRNMQESQYILQSLCQIFLDF